MAFSIFSKPQPVPIANGQAGARHAAPKQVKRPAKGGALIELQARKGGPLSRFSVTRYGSATERARAASVDKPKPSIELGPTGLGFSPALENAALLYASGQPVAARQILGSALTTEPESRASTLAWHAQFDLLQRAHEQEATREPILRLLGQCPRDGRSVGRGKRTKIRRLAQVLDQ